MPRTPAPPDHVHNLYESLTSDPELPKNVQWRIYRYALRTGKPALAAKLLSVPGLDPALDAELGTRREARIRAAWFGRPGRPLEEIRRALDAATRAEAGGAGAALAAVQGLPDDLYSTLVGRSPAAIHKALIANPTVPLDVKRRAARTLGPKMAARYAFNADRQLAPLFADQLHLLGDFAVDVTDPCIMAWVASRFDLPEEVLTDLVQRLVTALAHVDPKSWDRMTGIAEALLALAGQPRLPSAAARSAADCASLWQQYDGRHSHLAGQLLDAYRSPLKVHSNLATAVSTTADRVRAASTSQEILDAVRTVQASGSAELAAALVRNPKAGVDAVTAVLGMVETSAVPALAEHRARDLEVLAAISANHTGCSFVTDKMLVASGRPSDAIVEIVRAHRRSGKKLPGKLAESAYLTPTVMGELPLSFTATKGTVLARRAVTGLLDTALGGDADWELFENLGSAFEGPLENLLLACGYISHDAQASDEAPAGAGEPDDAGCTGVIADTLF